jgi:hypothetical protein
MPARDRGGDQVGIGGMIGAEDQGDAPVIDGVDGLGLAAVKLEDQVRRVDHDRRHVAALAEAVWPDLARQLVGAVIAARAAV